MSSVVAHNWSTLMELEPGDTVSFDRGLYSHWAVYEGNQQVIHLAGAGKGRLTDNIHSGKSLFISGEEYDKGEVRRDSFWKVAGENKAYKDNDKDDEYNPYHRFEILWRARQFIGREGYNLFCFNCEHFASLCRYGKRVSYQVQNIIPLQAIKTIADAAFAVGREIGEWLWEFFLSLFDMF